MKELVYHYLPGPNNHQVKKSRCREQKINREETGVERSVNYRQVIFLSIYKETRTLLGRTFGAQLIFFYNELTEMYVKVNKVCIGEYTSKYCVEYFT